MFATMNATSTWQMITIQIDYLSNYCANYKNENGLGSSVG